MRIDPAQLQMLALVGEHGSLTGAAAELGVTPAAVTGQLARAEERWGVTLVVRGPRGARLTDAGEALAVHGRGIIRSCDDARRDSAAAIEQIGRRLRIGTFMSAALSVLPEAVTALRHRHPEGDLSVVEGTSPDLRARVAAGELDVAVVGTYGEPHDLPAWLVATPLLRDPLVVCLPTDHRLAAGARDRRVRLSQLRSERWIVIVAGDAARAQFDRASTAADLDPQVQLETQSYDVAQALVATGLGVAVISQMAARELPGITHRALERPRLHRQLWAVHARDTRLTPLVVDFVTLCRQVGDDLVRRWAGQTLADAIRAQTGDR